MAFSRSLVVELAATPVRVQVVCPGIVATEFGGSSGVGVPTAMSAEDVAAASLVGLCLGETVCVPGIEDSSATVEALVNAETALLSGGNRLIVLWQLVLCGHSGRDGFLSIRR